MSFHILWFFVMCPKNVGFIFIVCVSVLDTGCLTMHRMCAWSQVWRLERHGQGSSDWAKSLGMGLKFCLRVRVSVGGLWIRRWSY